MPSRKTRKISNAERMLIGEKMDKMNKTLMELRSLVDMHCGDIVKTARAAGAAAAEEVIESMKTPFVGDAVPAFDVPVRLAPAAAPARLAPAPALVNTTRKKGPAKWNEFITNYLKNQRQQGRTITRQQAFQEAGPMYRAKYGIPEPKKKAVQIVEPQPLTPGRVSPPKPAPASTPFQSLVNAIRGTPSPNVPAPKPANIPITQSPKNSPNNYRKNINPLNSLPNFAPSTVSPSSRVSNVSSSYKNQGIGEAGIRKIQLDGGEYYLNDEDNALYERVDEDMGEFIGYLEPNGTIRYTNGA